MDVRCDKCGTEYEFDEDRVGASGVTVKCTACGYVFKVRRPMANIPAASTTIGKGPQGREWLVKKPDAQMIAFRELTTLQKWIVEGRISRDDEISKNGETWKKLGNILELEPFFSVYEKAQTLNQLIDRSNPEGQVPVELRGSDIVTPSYPGVVPAQPKPTSPPAPASKSVEAPRPSATFESAGSFLAGVTGASAGAEKPTAPPPSQEVSTLPPDAPRPGNGTAQPAAFAQASAAPEPRPVTEPPPTSAAIEGPSASRAPFATGFAGPGALGSSGIQPAAPTAFRDDAVPPYHESLSSDHGDVVRRFERGQRRKKLLLVLVFLVVVGLGAGVGAAMYGPEGNPVQKLAEKFGFIKAKPARQEAVLLLEKARSTADLDTLASLQEAESLLDQALTTHPDDAAIIADRALLGALRAGALLKWAGDLEARADRADKVGTDPSPSSSLRAEATEKRKLGKDHLTSAFAFAQSARQKDPASLGTIRAMAAYHLFGDDPNNALVELAKAKAITEKTQSNDAILLYLEAIHTAGSVDGVEATKLDAAARLLDKALTMRPTMSRARVLKARIHLAKREVPAAVALLDKVLQAAPTHQEALRLKERSQEIDAEITSAKKKEEEAKKAAEEAAKEAAKETPKEPTGEAGYDYWMTAADRLRERDQTQKALNAYDRAAELQPRSVEPLTGMGWCYLDLDKPQAAKNVFLRAVKANDRYAEAYYGVAESHRALGEKEKAVEYYEKYLEIAPKSSVDRRAAERQIKLLRGE